MEEIRDIVYCSAAKSNVVWATGLVEAGLGLATSENRSQHQAEINAIFTGIACTQNDVTIER